MINHVAEAFDHQQCIELLSKGNNIEIAHKAIDFYLEYSPMELNDMLVFLTGRLDHIRVVNQIMRSDNLPLLKAYLANIQQLNVPQINDPINAMWIEEGNHAQLRASVDAFTNFDMVGLAVKLESHECLEFRRIATHLYKKVQRWTQAVSLAKKDELYKDAIETAATSKDPALVDEILKFFVEKSNKVRHCATPFLPSQHNTASPPLSQKQTENACQKHLGVGWVTLASSKLPFHFVSRSASRRRCSCATTLCTRT